MCRAVFLVMIFYNFTDVINYSFIIINWNNIKFCSLNPNYTRYNIACIFSGAILQEIVILGDLEVVGMIIPPQSCSIKNAPTIRVFDNRIMFIELWNSYFSIYCNKTYSLLTRYVCFFGFMVSFIDGCTPKFFQIENQISFQASYSWFLRIVVLFF